MWSRSTEAGADLINRIAAPIVMELVIYPAIFYPWKRHGETKKTVAIEADATRALASPAALKN